MVRDYFKWLDVPVEVAARRLLGCELISDISGHARVRIVETEAYDQTDEASHTFRGRTLRNDSMFKSAGHMYVYFTYGMHHCCNIVTGQEGFGSGVLVRAVEPLGGQDIMRQRRGSTIGDVNLTNGPGKVCQALGIDISLSGHNLLKPPVRLIKQPALADGEIATTGRIGITKATDKLRRFYIINNPYVSRSPKRQAR